MGYLVYLYYPALLVLLFWGAKVMKRGEWNDEWFSLRQTKALQGFCAILIMLHHCGQKTCASWHPKQFIIPGLEPFVPIGYILVGVFLFCSGFGLIKSVSTKADYLTGFFRRRVLPVIAAYYLSSFIWLIVRLLMREPMGGWQIFCYIIGIKLGNINGWFVVVLPILYMMFYVSYRFIKNKNTALLVTCLLVTAYVLLGTHINHNRYWIQGQWWYNCIHFFTFGMLFARFEKTVTENIKKHYLIYVILAFVLFLIGVPVTNYAQQTFTYYGQDYHMDHVVLRRWITLLSQVLVSSALVFWVFLLGLKVRIGNKLLAFMGSITLEFYLMHGIFVELFGYCFIIDSYPILPSLYYIKNVALFVAVVFVGGVLLALLFKKLMNFVLRKKEPSVTKINKAA